EGLINMPLATGSHLIEVLGNKMCRSMVECNLFKVPGDPRRSEQILYPSQIFRRDRIEIEMRCPAGIRRIPLWVDRDELHTPRDDMRGVATFPYRMVDHE